MAPPRRRHLPHPAAALAVLALAAGALVLGSGAAAQDPGARTLTLKELDKGSTFTHIRNTKTGSHRANSQGDVIAFTNRLADESGTVVGKLSADCTTTTGSRNFVKATITCLVVLELRDGSLTVQTNVRLSKPATVGAVTGGTGAYAGARGVVVSKSTKSGSTDTITLEAE